METSRHAYLQPPTAPTTEDFQPPSDLPSYTIQAVFDTAGVIVMTYDRRAIDPLNWLQCSFTIAHPRGSVVVLLLPPQCTLHVDDAGGLDWIKITDQHWNCVVTDAQLDQVVGTGPPLTSALRFIPPAGGRGYDARVTIKARLSQGW